jgi:hypothetical protein
MSDGLSVKTSALANLPFTDAVFLAPRSESDELGNHQPGVTVVVVRFPSIIIFNRDFIIIIIKNLLPEATRNAAINTAKAYIQSDIDGSTAAKILADHAKEP